MNFGEAFIELHDLDGDALIINAIQVNHVTQLKAAGRNITVISTSSRDDIKVKESYETVRTRLYGC